MDAIDPVWIGIAGTLLALAVFANGRRIARLGGNGRAMGRLHMWIAPLFVGVIWFIILRLMPGA